MSDNIVSEIFFVLGEEKYVRSKVYPLNEDETVVISKAVFELRRQSGETEAVGSLNISGREMKALIKPMIAGKYILTETVTVGGETFKKRINITVTQR